MWVKNKTALELGATQVSAVQICGQKEKRLWIEFEGADKIQPSKMSYNKIWQNEETNLGLSAWKYKPTCNKKRKTSWVIINTQQRPNDHMNDEVTCTQAMSTNMQVVCMYKMKVHHKWYLQNLNKTLECAV